MCDLLPPFMIISKLPFIALHPESSLSELTLVTINGLSLPWGVQTVQEERKFRILIS